LIDVTTLVKFLVGFVLLLESEFVLSFPLVLGVLLLVLSMRVRIVSVIIRTLVKLVLPKVVWLSKLFI